MVEKMNWFGIFIRIGLLVCFKQERSFGTWLMRPQALQQPRQGSPQWKEPAISLAKASCPQPPSSDTYMTRPGTFGNNILTATVLARQQRSQFVSIYQSAGANYFLLVLLS